MGVQTAAERRRAYFAARSSTSARGYDWRWKKLRAAFLAQNPLCCCGCGRAATVVDHKRAHGGDPALLYDWNNLQAMTKPCHDAKTVRQDGGFGHPAKPAGPVTYTVASGADVWPRLGDVWPARKS